MSKTIKILNPETSVCTFEDGDMVHWVAYKDGEAIGSGVEDSQTKASIKGWRMIESAKRERKEANEPR